MCHRLDIQRKKTFSNDLYEVVGGHWGRLEVHQQLQLIHIGQKWGKYRMLCVYKRRATEAATGFSPGRLPGDGGTCFTLELWVGGRKGKGKFLGELQEQKCQSVTQRDRWEAAWGIENMVNLRPDWMEFMFQGRSLSKSLNTHLFYWEAKSALGEWMSVLGLRIALLHLPQPPWTQKPGWNQPGCQRPVTNMSPSLLPRCHTQSVNKHLLSNCRVLQDSTKGHRSLSYSHWPRRRKNLQNDLETEQLNLWLYVKKHGSKQGLRYFMP